MLVIGIKESAGFKQTIVLVKLAFVVLFIFGAIRAINPANWHPFVPPTPATGENLVGQESCGEAVWGSCLYWV